MKPDLDLALLELLATIDAGIEYPDAHHRVTAIYGLTVREGETLTKCTTNIVEKENEINPTTTKANQG